MMYLSEALVIGVGGALLALGFASAGSLVLPRRLGTGLPGSVLGGAKVALIISVTVSVILVLSWRKDSPLSILRKRPR